ncbi:RNA-directed DNA polymerase [Candidatus Saccharibacteria bacterium]|nr:RNA-directed DNA polymerase [Candidatus Saccharibacteria bacterium]
MVTTDGLLEAYYDCRRRKRRTASAIVYEMDYETKLIALRDRINNRVYQPGKSICFVVTRPRYREVFAASFEDRIVHHYIALRLEPLFELVFSQRTFNCRKEKGQLYGINILKQDIRDCSENYTRTCWIMKLDLQGFFMSIDKALLADLIDCFITQYYTGSDIDDLRYLCQIVVLHCPEKNCERHSPAHYWDYLPANKSLFTNGEGKGVAIGNLFAQLFANFLLNEFDWFLEEIGIKYHGRYVDDFYCIHQDKAVLLNAVPLIRDKLAEFGLTLNPKKFYFQHYTKGVEFTGAVVKPKASYCCNRTITNFIAAVRRLNNAKTLRQVEHAVCSINSYLGLLRHHNEYGTRKKVLGMIERPAYEYIYIKGRYEVVALKNKYKKRLQTYKRIRDGDY